MKKKNIANWKKELMTNSHRSDAEKVSLTEEKKIGINEVIKRNEIINKTLKQ